MKKFKAYLFDLDGTLIDSMPTFVNATKKVLEQNNIKYGNDLIKIITPLGYKGISEYFIKLGLKMSADEIYSLMQQTAQYDYANTIPAKKNVILTLKELKARGASLNVLTASPHTLLDCCLKRLGIFNIFDNVWSCNDFDMPKTNPEIYVKACKKIGVDINDVLFLDDNLDANMGAKKSGINTCGVYDVSSEQYKEQIKKVADYYIDDFSELL